MDKKQQKSIFIGYASGLTRVMFTHPVWSMKVRAQQTLPFTLDPRILYKGVGVSAVTYPLTVIIQIELNQFLQQACSTPPSKFQQVGSAFLAGIGASLINCPIEYSVIQQGLAKKSFYESTAHILKTYGVKRFFTAQLATTLRDSPFGAFFLAAPPFIEPYIQPYIKQREVTSWIAGSISGAGATLFTQPFDTVKTIQQSASEALSCTQAIQKIYKNHGVLGFFKGGTERGAMVMTSIAVLNTTRNALERALADGP
ncbi:MAG: solute carrier family 25 protein [Legionellaceae bacterium]|nr:solute carrier family 25 protein [Legionellaceae bacterium]